MKDLLNQLAEHIYYVNLDEATERRERCEEIISEHDLTIERVPAINGSTYETTGDMLANYKAQCDTFKGVFEGAIERDEESILIFEDDFEFTDIAIAVLTESLERTHEKINLVDDLTKPIFALDELGEPTNVITGHEQKDEIERVALIPNDWSMLSLGCITHNATNYLGGNVYKIRSASLGTAWVFKRNTFQPMIDLLDAKEKPYDVCISELIGKFDDYKSYAIMHDAIVYQRAGHSYNLGRYVDNSGVN